jgi:uncharacterized protein (DUF1501 family)
VDTLTRRRFLVASGVVGGTALAGGGIAAYSLRDLFDTAGDRPDGAKTLVVVTLYGGNDGLATVIPYADPAYRAARPELAYSGEQVLRLDDALGLNPLLKGLKARFDAGRVAIVNGVGYPKPDRSHFRSMDIWQTAEPDRPGNTGWLGRWLDAAGGDPRQAVSFEPVLPPLLAGATAAGAAVPLTGLRLPNGVRPALLSTFGKTTESEPPMQARAARAFADLVRVDEMVREVNEVAAARDPDDDDEPAATGTGGRTALGAQLEMVAKCIEANVATRVFSASLGGFDLHADEKATQEALLRRLDEALTGFLDRVKGSDVVVLVYSEFGRRVRANGSDGTDHGTAGPVFVLGEPVKGGLYGEQPSLTDLDNGDLKSTVDFRDVYATLLEGVLGTDAGKVLGGWKTHLPTLL